MTSVVSIEIINGIVCHIAVLRDELTWSVHRVLSDTVGWQYLGDHPRALPALQRIGVHPVGFDREGRPIIADADIPRLVDGLIDRERHA